jgi:hypothetical protein
MGTGTIIIGIVIVFICIAPFVWISYSRIRREKQQLNILNSFAEQHQCRVTTYEFGRGFSIGVDENSKCVFYMQKNGDRETLKHIPLREMTGCRVLNTSKNIKHSDGVYNIIEKLELAFSPADRNQPEILLAFYDAEQKMQLAGELQMIEKWSRIINGLMKKQKK